MMRDFLYFIKYPTFVLVLYPILIWIFPSIFLPNMFEIALGIYSGMIVGYIFGHKQAGD
jgi:hypothetical protein